MIEDITIPYSNLSQKINQLSWFSSFSFHVRTKNVKLLTPSFGGQQNLGEIGIVAAR